jgi:hypothetical protein
MTKLNLKSKKDLGLAFQGRCYDYNFLRFIISGKKLAFFKLKKKLTSCRLSDKRQFFVDSFGEKIFKIITSVPARPTFKIFSFSLVSNDLKGIV